jgi:pyruvate/2-oxoglutarate dehydrogenase complex dihydrolipoamide acyltransferase (E2) component
MAQVYEARLIGVGGFERRVALKRVLPQYAHDPSMRRMFFDEARLVSRLHHGNIVQVLDFGVVDESEFIAFEYVDGVDVARATYQATMGGVGLPEGVILHIIAETAHALQYAHGLCDDQGAPLGVIHRDVSPHNILLSWEGDVKLGDFGIALAHGREERTKTGIIKGKDRYMAPEQARGLALSSAVDVYALGVTLRELCGDPADISAECLALADACAAPKADLRPTAASVAEQAGVLASRTLSGTGRNALAGWLQGIRPQLPASSKLDDLMGLSLVGIGSRQFTVSDGGRATGGMQNVPTLPESSHPPAPTELSTPSEARAFGASRSRPGLSIALSALVGLAGALLIAIDWFAPTREPHGSGGVPGLGRSEKARRAVGSERERRQVAALAASRAALPASVEGDGAALRRPDASQQVSASISRALDGRDADPSDVDASSAAPASGRARAIGSDDGERAPAKGAKSERAAAKLASSASVASSQREARRRWRGRRRRAARRARSGRTAGQVRTERIKPPVKGPSLAKPALRQFGWLRVGGNRLLGGRVLLDGRQIGYAPMETKLPVGEHRLVVMDASSGEVLLSQQVSLGAHHTRGSPVRAIR